jgi:general secretion pathway protein I
MGTRSRQSGFTLLEVMVAVAILGLGLTAILSAQAGAFASAALARDLSEANGLLRCRMSEIEEDLARNGFQELDVEDGGACCDGADHPRMTCSWKIQKPTLPEGTTSELDLDANLDFGGDSSGSSALDLLSNPEALGASGDPTAALAGLAGLSGGGEEGEEGGGAGGIAGLFGMMFEMVYPALKPMYEASTRRVVVTISWRRGSKERSVDIEQWVVIPQAGVSEAEADAVSDLIEQATGGGTTPGGSSGSGGPSTTPVKPGPGGMAGPR